MPAKPRRKAREVFRNNGLSLALAVFFLAFLLAQSLTGHRTYNEERLDRGAEALSYERYLRSSHFVSTTMENWESEFLQMFAYVLMTVFLYQKGSSESKDPEREEEVDRDPRRAELGPDTPSPVRRGGFLLKLYESSLSLAFLLLFLVSFAAHAAASLAEYNEQRRERGAPQVSPAEYLQGAHFWFESFQNWQSEFLAIGSMVVLSIFLRQRGSPESKPVDAPHVKTGGG